jgi:hypothetical protein
MRFRVRFYDDANGNKPLLAFPEDLRKRDRILHKLVVAGIKKQQKVDVRELERARMYKKDWKQRHQ